MIEIPFRPHFREDLLCGKKTCTARNKKYGQRGEAFKAFGELFQITKIQRLPLSNVKGRLFLQEGCESPEHFQRIWEEIHPRKGFDPLQEVWVHFFRRVP